MLFAGAYVSVSPITNALGTQDVRVIVKKESIMPEDSIILSSDGFYDCMPSFSEDIEVVLNSVNMQDEIETVFNKYSTYQKDDTTVLFLRQKNIEIKEFNLDDESLIEKTPNHILSDVFLKQLTEAINEKNEVKCNKILKIINQESLKFEKLELDKLVKLMKSIDYNNYKIYRDIVKLMGKN